MTTRIKREARVWAIVLLMAASYLTGATQTDCWGWIGTIVIERTVR
ncbi:hypothetical protein OEW28_18575 [Defluviimonas sp. WL0002]|uniref:Uncharacterized protein n=1 Tax=Albidovulum marisflavi TaxID=2984159 RepID=A0ABT2ZHX0_9RHOB|nr:hypothetical protein [Defluviimonas sp. WL0002]MCV2870622.1 hypothetical protein [Defluviimonas sp. WL0002]